LGGKSGGGKQRFGTAGGKKHATERNAPGSILSVVKKLGK